MATLTIPGLGSNLPIDNIISSLMSVESQPLTQLASKEASYQAKISALSQVKGSLSSFQAAALTLQSASSFSSTQAGSSLSDVATLSATDKAAAANYSLFVEELAQNQKLATAAFSSASSVIGSGKLTFSFGTTSGATFTANPEKTAKTVDIPANATLNDIRDAVNAAKIGVTASVVNDGSGYRLVYTSQDTGTANSLKIVNSADSGALAGLAHDPAGTTLTTVQVAKDAKIQLDGITIIKSSNTITDAVDGLTITLKKKQTAGDASVALSVSKDSSGIKKTLDGFVKAYNDLNKTLKNLTAFDTSAEPKQGEQRAAAALNGESVVRNIQSQIRNVFNQVQDVGGAYRIPADVGIGFNTDGTIKLDATKLQKAIDDNPQDIAKLFGAVGTPSDAQIGYVSATTKTTTGSYAINLTGLQNGILQSAAAVPASLTVAEAAPATGQSFQVKINGTSSGMLTLANGIYNPASLATALQAAINGDATLQAAGAKVSVAVDSTSGKLLINSNKTGSSSSVEVVSGLSSVGGFSLFADASVGTPGQDSVSGTIGGYAAIGDGRNLTGAVGTAVEGLKISVDGGGLGDRGTVDLTRGFAFELDKILTGLLDSKNGPITSRTEGLNTSIKNIGKQRDALNLRLQDTEARYRKQFSALDTLVSQLNTTGNYLTQQLASLSSSNG